MITSPKEKRCFLALQKDDYKMKNKATNVIDWKNPGPEDIIWRYPESDIRFNSALVVREYEVAAFMRDGKLFDVFGPGRFILTTQNLPLLTRAYNFVMGYKETPFKADVIFCSKKMFNGRWGLKTMVKATKEMDAPMPLMANGEYQFRIEDPSLFITQVVGGLKNYTTASVNSFLRGFFNEKIMQELAQYTYMDVYTNLEDTSKKTQVNITDPFSQRGIELISLKIIDIDTEEKYKADLYKFQRFKSGPEGRDYRQFEVMDKMAESIGKSNGAGVGTGMLLFPQMYQQMTQKQPTSICPHCRSQIAPTSKFCPNCGKDITSTNAPKPSETKPVSQEQKKGFNICPYCGKELNLPKTPKFCPYCKEKLQ